MDGCLKSADLEELCEELTHLVSAKVPRRSNEDCVTVLFLAFSQYPAISFLRLRA